MTTSLRAIGLFGLLLFGGLLVVLVARPDLVQRSALSFVKSEVTREVAARYPDLTKRPEAEAVRSGLGRLSKRLGLQQERLEEMATSDLPERLGPIIERFCSCGAATPEGVAARVGTIRAGLQARVAAIGIDRNRVVAFAKGKYDETVAALRADLTIFLLVNAAAFAAVLGATFVPRARRHAVVVPAVLLVLATLACAAIYILGTDWFYAILFQDYMGWGYGAWLLVVFAFLADVVVNQARVTLEFLSHLPGALTVPAC